MSADSSSADAARCSDCPEFSRCRAHMLVSPSATTSAGSPCSSEPPHNLSAAFAPRSRRPKRSLLRPASRAQERRVEKPFPMAGLLEHPRLQSKRVGCNGTSVLVFSVQKDSTRTGTTRARRLGIVGIGSFLLPIKLAPRKSWRA